MKLSAVMRSCTVRPLATGHIEVRPQWLTNPSQLTRMAVAAEIERVLAKRLPKHQPKHRGTR